MQVPRGDQGPACVRHHSAQSAEEQGRNVPRSRSAQAASAGERSFEHCRLIRNLTMEYWSQEARDLLQQLDLIGNQHIKFWSQSIPLEGYIRRGSTRSILVTYTKAPRNLDGNELWSLMYRNMSRHARLTTLVDKVSDLASGHCLDIPDEFLCPITLNLMCDPVLAPDGHNYEYSAIAQWLRVNPCSPLTKRAMKAEELQTNPTLRGAIEQWATKLL